MAHGLDKYFKFGADRGDKGNTRKKRAMKKVRTPAFSCKRHMTKGLKTNMLSDCLVEHIGDNQFRVSFNKKPLLGKVFDGVLITRYTEEERVVGKPILENLDHQYANLQHIGREITSIGDRLKELEALESPTEEQSAEFDNKEKQEAAYKEQQESLLKALGKMTPLANKLAGQKVHYPKVKTKIIKLRVTHVVEIDEQFGSYNCIAIPFSDKRVTKTIKRWVGSHPDDVPKGVFKWLEKKDLLSILDVNAEPKHLGV